LLLLVEELGVKTKEEFKRDERKREHQTITLQKNTPLNCC
jgi:hypothetical protein